MATGIHSILAANHADIRAHLEELFRQARTDYPKGLVELCYGVERLDRHSYFGLSERELDEATAFIANRNAEGCNCYVGVNPRKPTTDKRNSGKDTDVEIAFWHFADLDKEEALARARGDLPIKPTMVVITGTLPNNRPHLYWRLEEPVQNLAAWTERQRGIAAFLGGDAVIDPRRIMRLAGTVNFPTPKKMERGYRVEVAALKASFASERPPVDPAQIEHAFPIPSRGLVAVQVDGQTNLQAMARTRVADLLAACQSGDEWHNSMVRLVAHLAAIGRSTAEILAMAAGITMAGFTVAETEQDMLKALQGARTKWALPEPEEAAIEAEEAKREPADSIFPILDMDELEALPPPTWLIHELIADHGLSVVYGDPGAGKSFVALDMALRLAFAMDWHGVATQRCGVLYIAGEGARGLGKRVKGWRREHAMEGVDAPFLLLPVAVQLLEPVDRAKLIRTITAAMERAEFAIGLVVIDTVSRALAGAEENGQEAMSSFVAACADIQNHTGGAVLAVHHSGKDKERGMRGSTVLLGGCDASIRLSKDGETVTLKTEKQKDAEESEPIYMTLKKVEWAIGLDDPQSTLVPFKRVAPTVEERALSREQISEIFDAVELAWMDKAPLTPFEHSRKTGKFAGDIFAKRFDMPISTIMSHFKSWQENGLMVTEERFAGRAKGLKVLRRIEL